MAYKTLRLEKIKEIYNRFLVDSTVDESTLDPNFRELRNICIEEYAKLESESQALNGDSKKYYIDLNFGFFIFEYLKSQEDFTAKYESNYDFWRYFAVCVIPDLIAKRWNVEKSDHFYSKPTAIYPFQIYWYINLSWQGNKEDTKNVLKDNLEDQILQLVDRPSSIGVNLALYRRIMYKLSLINPKSRQKVFRAVMMKNTAKLVSIRPELYEGGINAYVDMLYQI